MKKFFLSLAVFVMALCANAQTNQYFWYNGNLMMGNPIAQIDSVTFGEGEPADTLHILLPRTIIKEVHDTVYITIHDTVCPENQLCKLINDSTLQVSMPPSNEIWYTTKTGEPTSFLPFIVENNTLLSNTYENGKGVYKFESSVNAIQRLSEEDVRQDTITTSIVFPPTMIALNDGSVGCALVALRMTNHVVLAGNTMYLGTDAFCHIGNRSLENIHIYFMATNAPSMTSYRPIWNLDKKNENASMKFYFHYPVGSDYTALVNAVNAWKNNNNFDGDYHKGQEYYFIPTTYIMQ